MSENEMDEDEGGGDSYGNESGGLRRRINVGSYMPKRSFGLKLLLVCGLAFLMSIPTMFVWGLVHERSGNANEAVRAVSQARGGEQTILGPVLSIPFKQPYTEQVPNALNGQLNEVQRIREGQFVIFAKTGSASAILKTEMLKRGLHRVPVFDVNVDFESNFDIEAAMINRPRDAEFRWEEARIHMGMSDLRGAKDEVIVQIGNEKISLVPGEVAIEGAGADISSQLRGFDLGESSSFDIKASMHLTGAQRVGFAAFAQNTNITLEGDWNSPSFEGGFLPADRTINDNGFYANWRVPFLARGLPASGVNIGFYNLRNTDMGVSLLDETSPYQSVMRALKYAPMFVGLVFLAYFLFEATSVVRAHPAQYVLVGLAQAVFYLLLLGVSEHAGFTIGFFTAAIATVMTLSLYAGSVFGGKQASTNAFIVFTSLYALIYVLMRMEDYALLMGSIASFAAIAFTMWKTRDLDWYGLSAGDSK